MSERPKALPRAESVDEQASDPSSEESRSERSQWSSEDDELLLLDEIEETPDDDRIEHLV